MASSYLLANAACIPLWGKISDIWGRKPIILIGNVIFLVGSLVCALAKDLTMMLAGRAVQGVGGGGLIILSNIVVTDLFSVRYVLAVGCCGASLTDQGTSHILWPLWRHMGRCKRLGPDHRRCVYDSSNLALVLLPEPCVFIPPLKDRILT